MYKYITFLTSNPIIDHFIMYAQDAVAMEQEFLGFVLEIDILDTMDEIDLSMIIAIDPEKGWILKGTTND